MFAYEWAGRTVRTPLGNDLEVLQHHAAEAARLLRLLGNERRLLVLCRLMAEGEMSVGALAEAAELSQPALSQHLALLRGESVVATRRNAKMVLYRLADPKAARLLVLLRDVYREPEG